MSDTMSLNNKVSEKFQDLIDKGFEEAACFDFFASLTLDEINYLLDLIREDRLPLLEKSKLVIMQYLQKLAKEIEQRLEK